MNETAGFFYLFLLLGGLILGIVWLVFPFVVSSGLSAIVRQLRKQNELLEKISKQQPEKGRPPTQHPPRPTTLGGGFQ